MQPRRSVLAVPGSNPKMIEKAKGLPADAVFLDLEDAVAPLAKEEARANVVAGTELRPAGAISCVSCGSTTGPPRRPTPT